MSTEMLDRPADQVSKPTRIRKATSRRSDQVAIKPRKVSFYLSAESVRRLGVAASMEDSDRSALLERVIRESPVLRRWVIQDRSRPEPTLDTGDIGQTVAA